MTRPPITTLTVGVLALQGAFYEHIKLLHKAISHRSLPDGRKWTIIEVRTPQALSRCDALIIPGGESTTVSLVAERSGLLEPLRDRTKRGGHELIGGLDVRVNRNFFGRQTESFEAEIELPFLSSSSPEEGEKGAGVVDMERDGGRPFMGVFIRAPVVEKILPSVRGEQKAEKEREELVIAPGKDDAGGMGDEWPVEVIARLPGRSKKLKENVEAMGLEEEVGDIVAVRQRNVFGTSFHPELTADERIHVWWLQQVVESMRGIENG
ncbi:MAG: hypothetical protein Q9218_002166 [Villophora microphyllina]